MRKQVQSTHLTEAALSASRKKRLPFLFEAIVPLVQVIGPAARELKNCHHFALYKSKVECNPHEIKVQSIKVRFGPIVGMRIRLGVMLVCKNILCIQSKIAFGKKSKTLSFKLGSVRKQSKQYLNKSHEILSGKQEDMALMQRSQTRRNHSEQCHKSELEMHANISRQSAHKQQKLQEKRY